MLFYVG